MKDGLFFGLENKRVKIRTQSGALIGGRLSRVENKFIELNDTSLMGTDYMVRKTDWFRVSVESIEAIFPENSQIRVTDR